MDEKTLEALKDAIALWERIRDDPDFEEGDEKCPLCKVFFGDYDRRNTHCVGCPIYDRTGLTKCHDTPYYDYEDGDTEGAQREIDFLRSLLPEEEE